MKTPIIYLFILVAVFSCKKENKLTFEPLSFENKNCKDCANVTLEYPSAMANTKIGKVVNSTLTEEIIFILDFNEENTASDVQSAISSFQKEYENLKAKYAEEATPWEANIKGYITFEDETILTIKLESHLFTGGAHGYSTVRFLNFDKINGVELENSQLFKNQEAFVEFAEVKFREQEKIPKAQTINSTGFMFDSESFYLPENIGFTNEGLQLFYEQYEIASFADGPIILTLPYAELKEHLTSLGKS